jgi:hypothetical protein
VDKADLSTATVRTASRMARRMAGGRASVNDIRVSFQRVRGFGEGQAKDGRDAQAARDPVTAARRPHVSGGGHAERRIREDSAARRGRSGGDDGR